jgi:two-component system NtrC family sensor kinase
MIRPIVPYQLICIFLGLAFISNAQENMDNPEALNQWVSFNLANSDDTSGLYKNAHRALFLSLKNQRAAVSVQARRNLSIYHENYGRMDSAIYFMKSIANYYASEKDTSSLAKTYLEIKQLYTSKADYTEAAKQVYAALELYEKIGNKKGIALCYTDLCDLLYYEDKYEQSVAYCDKAIAIQKDINAREDLAISLRYKASSQLFSGADLENALSTINQAIEIYKGMEGKDVELMASINGRGNILKYLERYEEAIADYKSNYDKCIEIGFKPYLIPSISNIGHVYKLQGKYEEALPYFLQSIDLMLESEDTKNLWENYLHARNIYAKLGDYVKAYDYSILYSDAYAAYQKSIIERLESEAQIKYETAKKDEIIAGQEKEIKQQQQIQWLYISIGVLLLLSLAGMLISRSKIRKKQKEIEQSRQDLMNSIENLKATQQQLIHAEKMASLGELTAGIAHEIQNPLNFVNNFAEVSEELAVELKDELNNKEVGEAKEISLDIIENLKKISQHGKRASFIVKGMLEHSRTGSGEKTPTDIKLLAEEFLKLSYHGLRAKDKSFQADFEIKSAENIPKINLVSQDIGRVLLNLINNAFYAVGKKAEQGIEHYQPKVIIEIKNQQKQLEISVKDNGNGIPVEIKDKIFQPFFTTKPTGEGTGLGLSLSYDIITKGHGGEMLVQSQEGKGTEFIIKLEI